MQVKTLSCARLFAALWTIAYQAPPAITFPEREKQVVPHLLWASPNVGSAYLDLLVTGRLCSRSHQEIPSLLWKIPPNGISSLLSWHSPGWARGFLTCRLSYFEMYLHFWIDCNVQSSLWQRFCFTHLLEFPGFSTLREKIYTTKYASLACRLS